MGFMRATSLVPWFQASLVLCGCVGKAQDDTGVVSSSFSSSSSTSPGGATSGGNICGDGSPSPGEFCFENVPMADLTFPLAAVGGVLDAEEKASFVVLMQLTDEIITIRQNAGKMVQSAPVKIGHNAERQLRLANLEATSLPELIVTSVDASSGALLNQNGGFSPFKEFALPDETGIGRLVPLDVDGDGFAEVMKGTDDTARLWKSVDGKWTIQDPTFTVDGCKVFWDAAVGDFNSDGLEDVAFIGAPTSWDVGFECEPIPNMRIKVLLATGGPDLLKEVQSLATNQTSAQIVTGDLDGDAVLDLAVASGTDEGVIALKGLGQGQFSLPVQVVESGQRVLAGDYDGDGIAELATNRYTPDALTAQVWIIDSVFDGPTLHQIGEANALLLATADVNNDGVDDLATMSLLDAGPHLAILISGQ